MYRGKDRLPSYCRHKATGQAVVTLSGRDVYLGPHGTKLSRENYDRVVGEWLAAGRTLVRAKADDGITVVELVNAFRKSLADSDSHAHDYKGAMSVLVRVYGRTPAAEFGPLALKAVREQMIAAGWNRKTVNTRFYMVRRIFRWGVEHEILPPSVSHALAAVAGLRSGKSAAPEPQQVAPVAIEHVEATIPHMPAMVQTMVRLQMLTGMRAGELVILRSGDIDTTGATWVYRPTDHKTQHIGKVREIAIGPKAQRILAPLLKPDLAAFVFSPAESERQRRGDVSSRRVTPARQGNRPGTNRVRNPRRSPGDRYDVPSYRRAIYRACDAAFPPPASLVRLRGENEGEWMRRLGDKWNDLKAHRERHRWHPHQLRHTFATESRRRFGLEHTQRALGHSNANITQVYAAVALEKAIEVAQAIG